MNKKPFLGVCLGFQTAVIEFARNVLNLENAHTAECDPTVENPVIIDMPEHNTGDMGGTMRLGKRTTVFKPSAVHSKISKLKFENTRIDILFCSCFKGRLYEKKDEIQERHRHRYEVNPKYIADLEKHGLKFVGMCILH